jgi:hypothetical protein
MNLSDTIYAHAKVLPVNLQREALDFIDYLSHRHQVAVGRTGSTETAAFISRFAGTLGDDFPNDIDESDLGLDHARETME